MTNTTYNILLDTNIIAYVIASNSPNLDYRIRARLTRNLIEDNNTIIILYEEQRYHEIPRTVEDLIIMGRVGRHRIDIVEALMEEIETYLNSLEEIGKVYIIKRDPQLIIRAGELYKILNKHYRGKIRGKISSDLKLIATAEKENATITTRDNQLYNYYRKALHEKTNIPSMYYLDIDPNGKWAGYKICGQRIKPLEIALSKACIDENIAYKIPQTEC